jgi:phosphoglycerate dehydrogenase-like enzyme
MNDGSASSAAKVVVSYGAPESHLDALRRIATGFRVVRVESVDEAQREIADARVFLGNPFFLQSLPFARELRWMQSNSAGADLILGERLAREHPFVLTLARGVYDEEMADHALALLYAALRDLPGAFRAAAERRWQRRSLPHLAGRTAFVFGWGGVGQAIARRLMAAKARVVGVRRNPDGGSPESGVEIVDLATGMRRLPDADVVLLALPLSPETRGLFDRAAFSALRDGVFVVNVARGGLIDESALADHLDRLGGVGLDVFAEEPLPAAHFLWSHPRVVLTPHVARSPDAGPAPWLPLFELNLARFVAGQALLHVADKERGY